MKKKLIPPLLTIIAWFLLFYFTLPAINIKSPEGWNFMVMALLIAVVINFWSIVKALYLRRNDQVARPAMTKGLKAAIGVIGAFLAVYLIGNLLSSPILRAGDYSELISVNESVFAQDVKIANFNEIPILDSDSAARIAERQMGTMADMVSQYEVSPYFSQINYKSKPVRVTPLKYGSEIKWLTNRSRGIPAYITIDMTTQNAEIVRLSEGIKITPSEYFGRDLLRYIRFKYPTQMFRGMYFEIDDNGTPFWICPVADHTIGLFGGTDIVGAVVVNAIDGDHTYYNIDDVPQWIDKVYDAELLVEQYNYYGTLKDGFLNSVLSQKNCFKTTTGYNYIALDDDVWVYTGITSVGGDQSNVGFVLMNQRTKETNYYPVSGAEEFSAMASAEGQVQHLGYTATFPLLLNVGGEPTYFLSLKDSAGLVKKYAMINIQKYQIVAIGDTVVECERVYKNLMKDSGIDTVDTSNQQSISGNIKMIKDIVKEGSTYYYIMLENNDDMIFELKASDDINVIKLAAGDRISIEYIESSVAGLASILSFK